MAPFNKRQIGYIQAVAGRQQHTTLICGAEDGLLDSRSSPTVANIPQNVRKCIGAGVGSGDSDSKSLFLHTWHLDNQFERAWDARAVHNNDRLESADFDNVFSILGMGPHKGLSCFDAEVANVGYAANGGVTGVDDAPENLSIVASHHRATNEGYLHSTDIKFRFTLPTNVPQVSWEDIKDSFNHDVQLLEGTDQRLIPNTPENMSWWKTVFDLYNQGKFDGLDSTITSIFGSSWATIQDTIRGRLTDDIRKHISTAIESVRGNKPMGQDHYEFRWIVWRNKNPTYGNPTSGNNDVNLDRLRDGVDLKNPGYDLFVGQTGRKRGFLGYRLNPSLDGDHNPLKTDASEYLGYHWDSVNLNRFITRGDYHPEGERSFTVDDLLTMRLNKDDYLIMKDVRFFLGKEHGKSHFEDTLHWDWNDPINTPERNVLLSNTLNDKNFRWHMTLIGTTNGKSPVILNEHVRWTTKMTSG